MYKPMLVKNRVKNFTYLKAENRDGRMSQAWKKKKRKHVSMWVLKLHFEKDFVV